MDLSDEETKNALTNFQKKVKSSKTLAYGHSAVSFQFSRFQITICFAFWCDTRSSNGPIQSIIHSRPFTKREYKNKAWQIQTMRWDDNGKQSTLETTLLLLRFQYSTKLCTTIKNRPLNDICISFIGHGIEKNLTWLDPWKYLLPTQLISEGAVNSDDFKSNILKVATSFVDVQFLQPALLISPWRSFTRCIDVWFRPSVTASKK